MIDEGQKKWGKKVTAEEYDLKLLSPKEFCKKYGVTRKRHKQLLGNLS